MDRISNISLANMSLTNEFSSASNLWFLMFGFQNLAV